jgi:cell division protein FtsQ
MATVSATTDKRFRRAQVKPGSKRRLPARRVWLALRTVGVAVVLGVGLWRMATLVADAQGFQVGHLVVRGQERLSAGEVLSLVDGLRGQNILLVRLDPWRERLMSSPWVEDASIRRVLPSTLEIAVRERRPMGIGRIGTALYLVDRSGVVIDEYGPAYADLDLPIVDGLAAPPQDGAALVDPELAEFAARVIASLGTRPELAKLVSQIDVSDRHNAVVILDGDTALLRLGEGEFVERLQQYVDLAPALRERLTGIDYVDLRFDERLYVRPARPVAANANARARR